MIWLLLAVVHAIVFSLRALHRIGVLDIPLACALTVCVLLASLCSVWGVLSHIHVFPAICFVAFVTERCVSWHYIGLGVLHRRMILLFTALVTSIACFLTQILLVDL